MSGARLEADPRFTFHVSRLTFHGSCERAENDADGCGSFAAIERSMSDRLLRSALEVLLLFLLDLPRLTTQSIQRGIL